MLEVSDQTMHNEFLACDRPHILMITNHGVQEWNVNPGLPDTGGQVMFVNELSHTLAQFGFRVTIANRGGYPHPESGEMRQGISYYNQFERLVLLEDSCREFVRKEDMDAQLPELADFLKRFTEHEGIPVNLLVSHYWDAAKLGVLYNKSISSHVRHIWVPHSLGALKKHNMPPESWPKLRIDERIENEKNIIPDLDGVAATSLAIKDSLHNDYNYDSDLFLPPCVDAARFQPRTLDPDHEIYHFLGKQINIPPTEVKNSRIVTEISRTDATKRKDVLIKAFAKAYADRRDLLLVLAVDQNVTDIAAELNRLIADLGIRDRVICLGQEKERLPYLYATTAVYCSPSVMEGFGMAVQEAAATKVPVVGSDKIPFVSEYLLGDNVKKETYGGMSNTPFQLGEGGIVVPADDVDAFSAAISMILDNPELAREMGEKAYHITIPYFTWDDMTRRLLETMGVHIPQS